MNAPAGSAKKPRGEALFRDLTGRKLGRYEILSMLASGGMATVYVARAQGVAGFERLVAIKVLHPHMAHEDDFISMFLDEARLAARIRHPNVVGTLDISDTDGDGFFLVMEYVEGDHLGGLMKAAHKAGGRLPTKVVSRLLLDALEGLSAAHQLKEGTGRALEIVHRDISPHNILVGKEGVARITDFGVAKAEVRLSSTREGQFKGKLSYMAPEQAADGHCDQRSDLFSMGIVLWESLVGGRLFKGKNNAEVLNKILYADAPAPSRYWEELAPFDAVTQRALHRDPEERFQSAEEFILALEEAAKSAGGIASRREVAKEVKELLGDKLEADHARIQRAIELLGRSELHPGVLPLPQESSYPSMPSSGGISSSGQRPRSSVTGSGSLPPLEDQTMGARPSNAQMRGIQPEPKRSPLLLVGLGAGGVLLLLMVGLGAWWAGHRSGAERDPAGDGEPVDGATAAEVSAATAEPPAEPPAASPATGEIAEENTNSAQESEETSDSAQESEENSGSSASGDEDGEDREARRRRRQERRERQQGTRDEDLIANPYRR